MRMYFVHATLQRFITDSGLFHFVWNTLPSPACEHEVHIKYFQERPIGKVVFRHLQDPFADVDWNVARTKTIYRSMADYRSRWHRIRLCGGSILQNSNAHGRIVTQGSIAKRAYARRLVLTQGRTENADDPAAVLMTGFFIEQSSRQNVKMVECRTHLLRITEYLIWSKFKNSPTYTRPGPTYLIESSI